MNLVLITGFLGSGKTTLAINLARIGIRKGLRVAIVVNEIGEIGIDDQFMRSLGLNVWELLGGCICCTLAGSLTNTLRQLETDFAPNLILVEPSGAADPRHLLSAVETYQGSTVESRLRIALLDPLRMKVLMAVLTPLVTSTITHADLILINKADLASSEEMEYARCVAGDINPAAKTIIISAKNGPELPFWSELLPYLR
jgi:G3E family GTPase